MKKAKAIELLKLAVPIKALTQQEYADFVEAVNMGMDALEQPTSPDTIDRKAALDALRKCQTYLYDARDPELKIKLSSAEAAINNLPTIQPEKAQLFSGSTTSDLISRQEAIDRFNVIRPVDPKKDEYTKGTDVGMAMCIVAVKDQPTVPPEPTDIDAREAVYNLAEKIGIHQLFALTVELRGEPIQPEPQEGHWIKHESPDGSEQYECSECGVLWEFNEGTPEDNEAYFCPKCGKKLITK